MKKLSKRGMVLLFAGLMAFVVFLIYSFQGDKETPVLRVTGTIDGPEVNLSAKTAGRISWICCNEGEAVNSGQAVITIESEDIKASVAQALAAVERAQGRCDGRYGKFHER